MDFTSIRAFFTPTVLFIILNLVIGTIYLISTLFRHQHHHHPITRSSSSNVYDHLRSIGLFRFRSGELPPIHDSQQTLIQDGGANVSGGGTIARSSSSNVIDLVKSVGLFRFRSGDMPPINQEHQEQLQELVEQKGQQQFRRIRSESESISTLKEEKETVKMREIKKSVSAMTTALRRSAARTEVVERRTAAGAGGGLRREEVSVDSEVDAKADDFINRFKQQLKLQRLDSILRYKENSK